MSAFPLQTARGSFLMPRFENATVADVMRHGVITCTPETPLRTIARMMSGYHVHAVVVTKDDGEGGHEPWGIVSDFDVLGAAHEGCEDLTAGQVSRTPVVMVAPDDALAHAAQLMREHSTSHLLVIAAGDSRPVGVVSTLDVAGALAWGEG